jgi:hypothetical protein
MSKAMSDERLNNKRTYSSTNNVFRPLSHGSNNIAVFEDYIIPEDKYLDGDLKYDSMYLGECHYKRYNKNINDKEI